MRHSLSVWFVACFAVTSCLSSIVWARGGSPGGGRGAAPAPARTGSAAPSGVHRGPPPGTPRPIPHAGPYPRYHGRYGGHPQYAWGYPYYGYPYYGYGVGVGFGYPVYVPYGGTAYYSSTTVVQPAPVVATAGTAASAPAGADPGHPDRAREFDERGKAAFRNANYADAAYEWRHAIVDAPQNPTLIMQLSLALFALGKYEESAGALQAGMRQIGKEYWGDVIAHYRNFYGDPAEYTRQLRTLETAIASSPENPAMRFLAGYHFGYLGFQKQSVEQLDKLIALEPRDELAKALRNIFQPPSSANDGGPALPPVPAFDQPERITK